MPQVFMTPLSTGSAAEQARYHPHAAGLAHREGESASERGSIFLPYAVPAAPTSPARYPYMLRLRHSGDKCASDNRLHCLPYADVNVGPSAVRPSRTPAPSAAAVGGIGLVEGRVRREESHQPPHVQIEFWVPTAFPGRGPTGRSPW